MKRIDVSFLPASNALLAEIVRRVEARNPGCSVSVEIDDETDAPLYIEVSCDWTWEQAA